jgi:tetratricopeptide (TPR) repeat protein
MGKVAQIHAKDPFGNTITVNDEASAAAVNGFINGFLGYQPSILDIQKVADTDHHLIVQACAAALCMFSEAPGGVPQAKAHLARAAQAKLPTSERERQFAAAVASWVNGEWRQALVQYDQLARHHPRDLTALKLGQYLAFNLGESPTMLTLALHARQGAKDVAWMHGLLAFAWEQNHRMEEAETEARCALAMQPNEPWAQHALAHVMLTQGRYTEGLEFMTSASGGWQGLTSFMRCHNWWHTAIFHIELGDDVAAMHLYDQQVWGVDKNYSQDQVGAVSLLCRLEMAGVAVGERWGELADYLQARVADQVQPFLDLQYLYGLARVDRPQAAELLRNIEQFAPHSPQAARVAWQQVAVPMAHGLVAHAKGRWKEAVEHLTPALPRLASIGGSHAQRDLFEQIYIDALQRCGQWAGVQNLVQPRANAQPQSQRLKRQLLVVDSALGLPARF